MYAVPPAPPLNTLASMEGLADMQKEILKETRKRRWPSATAYARDGGAFYSYQEWLSHFCSLNYDEAFARELWGRAELEDETEEERQARALLWQKSAIEALPPMDLRGLGGVHSILLVLQAYGSNGEPGTSLRETEDGGADTCGDALSALLLELLTPHSARIRGPTGGYLRYTAGGILDFRGSAGGEETVFEVLIHTLTNAVTLASSSGQVLGTFLPRCASQQMDQKWWTEHLLAIARTKVAGDERLRGRRRHPRDRDSAFYTFEEWVKFVDEEWLSGNVSMVDAAVLLAERAWETDLVPEEIDMECATWIEQDEGGRMKD